MKGSATLLTICLVLSLLVTHVAASEYTRLSEQNITDAKESLSGLDLIGAIEHMLDAMHWSNMASDSVAEVVTVEPTLIPSATMQTQGLEETVNVTEAPTTTPPTTTTTTEIQTTVPTTVQTTSTTIVTTVPTMEPTTVVTTIPTTEPTPEPTPTKDAKGGVKKALDDSISERATPLQRNESEQQ